MDSVTGTRHRYGAFGRRLLEAPITFSKWSRIRRALLSGYQDQGRHKTIDHPDVGHITLDCDTLVVAADDLRIMIFTAEPGTEDAERLTLARVLGTQSLID